jgi:predicted CDP-diglyceride synthetase/phosphatidate cytidylyltransferase
MSSDNRDASFVMLERLSDDLKEAKQAVDAELEARINTGLARTAWYRVAVVFFIATAPLTVIVLLVAIYSGFIADPHVTTALGRSLRSTGIFLFYVAISCFILTVMAYFFAISTVKAKLRKGAGNNDVAAPANPEPLLSSPETHVRLN